MIQDWIAAWILVSAMDRAGLLVVMVLVPARAPWPIFEPAVLYSAIWSCRVLVST